MLEELFKKNCPFCGKEQLYKERYMLKNAIRDNRKCNVWCGISNKIDESLNENGLYERNCPDCNKLLSYKSRNSFCQAEKKKKSCMSCTDRKELRYNYIPTPNGLVRNCPSCNRELKYKRKGDWLTARNTNSKCLSCSIKINIDTTDYNANKRIKRQQRAQFHNWLKGRDNGFEKYVGMSLKEFKMWFALDFKDNMAWGNWSRNTWHIDHIKPLCQYDLTKEQECKFAWSYMNLRPLDANENFSRPKNGDFSSYVMDKFEKAFKEELLIK